MELVQETVQQFKKHFGSEPEVVVTAPGRVNLIGEHTDYNDGFVLPMAIERAIVVTASKRNDDKLALYSVDFQSSVEVSLSKLERTNDNRWSNYLKGVAYVFLQNKFRISGANICIHGNVPIAAGLSSSAALEVASAVTFQSLFNLQISSLDLIKLAQQAETDFVGVQCGIMDQFISLMGQKNNALFLDCRTLSYQFVPFPVGVKIIVFNTGVKRELASSAYNQRKSECEEAVRELSQYKSNINSLRNISLDEFKTYQEKLSPIISQRAMHVITENERVQKSVEAMKRNDLKELGKLMIESHMSLRDNYEVSCKELDSFVDIAIESEGVYGARMTGAGFGGCGICLVDEQSVDSVVEQIKNEYPKLVAGSPSMYVSSPEDGAKVTKM